jgi:hypothetical protein
MATIVKYNSFLKNQMNGGAGTAALVVDFDTNTLKAALVSSVYTPSATTHVTFNDITNEVSGTNYSAGGATLTTATLTESSGTVTFDADDVVWAQDAAGFTNARYVILYKSTGTASTSPLIGYIDLVSDKGNVSGSLTIQWNASGIITWA